ncbi:PREDICTED: SAGA-associated factor 29-like [Myotis davidii]|uniref:SAGA-associated factor 29-like n=1 Tax=Myotis davidii TaxID=225400 RepID=UPI00076799AC|nr:PREDICTED: SAGA-associated factor 29-like [Myotis davidii]
MPLLQQSAMTLPLWIGKPGDKPPPLCGAIPASGDYVAKPGDKVAARVKAVDGDEQWILAEVVSYSHATNKYEVDDIDEEGKERHTLSRRRIIPLPQWKANPETALQGTWWLVRSPRKSDAGWQSPVASRGHATRHVKK